MTKNITGNNAGVEKPYNHKHFKSKYIPRIESLVQNQPPNVTTSSRLLTNSIKEMGKSFRLSRNYFPTIISFSSSNTQFYESRIFCLFTFWVFFPDKSFKLISKYTQKCQYNYKKNNLQHLRLEKLKFGIRKIGCSMSWTI